MKLYELSAAFKFVADMMDTGTEGLEDTLESIEGPMTDKIESIIKLYRSKLAEADAIDLEVKRLQARMNKLNKDADWLFEYAESNMKLAGINEVKSPLFTIKLGKNPAKVVINEASLIPEQYIRHSLTVTTDKNAIKDALKEGKEVPGCGLVNDIVLKIK